VSGWLIFALLAAGFVLGWLGGHMAGFYFGRRLERKRLARLLANKTALEVVRELMASGKLSPAEKKKASPPAGPSRDETRH
jgi:membrane protein DedA with SNARE-associated domain